MRKVVPLSATATATAVLLFVGACNSGSGTPSKPTKMVVGDEVIDRDASAIEMNVRLSAANKRIDDLEAKIEVLKTNSQSIDLELVKQRVEVLESKVYLGTDDNSSKAEKANKKQTTRSYLQEEKPSALPSLLRKSPVLPRLSRVATKDEADAFAKRKD
jgi:TolA-binding protein